MILGYQTMFLWNILIYEMKPNVIKIELVQFYINIYYLENTGYKEYTEYKEYMEYIEYMDYIAFMEYIVCMI